MCSSVRSNATASISMRSARRKLLRGLAALLASSAALSLVPSRSVAQSTFMPLPATPTLPEPYAQGHVARPDAKLWFATFGEAKAPAVLLLHGGGGSSDYWGGLIRLLSTDHFVVVVDSRGQGRSTNDAAHISYEQMAEDAIAVLDHLKIGRAAVVGWSDGANTGFYLALNHAARISALLAFAGNATPAGYQPNTNPALMQAYVARTRAEYERLSPTPARYGEEMKKLSLMWKTQPSLTTKDLQSIRVRTLVLHAEHDEIIRRTHSEEIARAIPDATLVILSGAGHFALLQQADAFNRIAREFLSRR